MQKLRLPVCALLLMLGLSSCGSLRKQPTPPVAPVCLPPPAPAAWMMAPSNSLILLDKLISISE